MLNVRTVLGDIPGEKIGFTYPHEHLWCCPPPVQKDRDLELTDYEGSLYELRSFKEIGGQTLVDASTLDYGRDGKKLKALSEESGVNVIAVTGFNKHIYYPRWVEVTDIAHIRQRLMHDIKIGMDFSDAKAGILKGGTWYNMIHPLELKTTQAIIQAHQETSAPIWMHTEAGTMGMEILDILEKGGVPAKAICLGHIDRNADPYYHKKLLERGVYLQFDGPGKVKYFPDSTRVELIQNIVEHGFEDQLLISGDMGRQSYLTGYGGGPGFTFIKTKFLPRLIDQGIPEAAVHKFFYENPAAWLARF
ncbi:MAG: phosphotriesterase-related protein [Anaerolineaceae bacterium]|nr:phosphotriesterase-related protein [Anaerolineaceae bacterium]